MEKHHKDYPLLDTAKTPTELTMRLTHDNPSIKLHAC